MPSGQFDFYQDSHSFSPPRSPLLLFIVVVALVVVRGAAVTPHGHERGRESWVSVQQVLTQ